VRARDPAANRQSLFGAALAGAAGPGPAGDARAVGDAAASDDLTVTGVDGCAAGWVAVTLSLARSPAAACAAANVTAVNVSVAAALDGLPLAGVTGIDMPLGLLADGWRDVDLLARRALGRRGVTVFAIPPRPVWACPTYAEANRACRGRTGKGLSVQAWGLRRKIAEAEEFRRRTGAAPGGTRLYEVHPELSFAAMAGAPLPDSKHTPAGLTVRRALLAESGIAVPPKVVGVQENDLLDAAAVAWSACRIAAGTALVLTSPAQRADDGTEIAIRY
jgi:predicted RNase H-like nuclease